MQSPWVVARYEGCTLVLNYDGTDYYYLPGSRSPVVTPTPTPTPIPGS